jgi:hypothetical protein
VEKHAARKPQVTKQRVSSDSETHTAPPAFKPADANAAISTARKRLKVTRFWFLMAFLLSKFSAVMLQSRINYNKVSFEIQDGFLKYFMIFQQI